MLILLHRVRALDIKSLELIVIPHLMARRDLKGSDRDNLAIDLHCAYSENKPVNLHEVLRRWLHDLLALRDQLVLDFFSLVRCIRLNFLVSVFLYGSSETQNLCFSYIQQL